MTSLILRTATPLIVALTVVFSIFVLLRGHNEPGGGFIGALIGVSALAIYGIAHGAAAVRRALHFSPLAIGGFGLALAVASGLVSALAGDPFLTGQWWIFDGEVEIALSTPLVFDIGVYLTVIGAVASVALALEEGR